MTLRWPAKSALLVVTFFSTLASIYEETFAQGFTPEQAVARMTVPPGFKATLVASEPMVRQPVCIEFDDRGRLWVINIFSIPNPAGLTRVKVDRFSRTVYDHVPEPPPKGPKGADRITVLEDTNGDGRMDKSHDFVSGLNLTTGLAFGHGGVYVLNVPYLLFYPDRNHDDVPDGDPEVLLTGFGMQDAHSVANSLTWGPDGWLYGTQGSTVTSNIRGIEFQQGVWRFHPITHKFELFCEGGGNSWGLDFDRHGELFYSTNSGDFLMAHGVQGAYYIKAFGKHGALHNPFSYGYFDHVLNHGFKGGHVTVGGVVYQGDSFPASFRDKYIGADLLGHAVYWNDVKPRGSTVETTHVGDLIDGNDTWFAPSDVTIGPDGAVYVADWTDRRTAHPDPDAEWDRSNGRIYAVQADGAKREPTRDLSAVPSNELLGQLTTTNEWYARRAMRILADRRDSEVIFALRNMLAGATDERVMLRSLWSLYVSGGFNEAVGRELLAHANPHVRRWTVRFLGDDAHVSDETATKLATLAVVEQDVSVRAQLASTAKRLPVTQAVPLIEALLSRTDGKDDPFLPLLTWWAVEHHALQGREALVKFFAKPEAWSSPIARDVVVGRLVRRYAAQSSPETLTACAAIVNSARDPAVKRALVANLDDGLRDRGGLTADAAAQGTWMSEYAARNAAASSPAVEVQNVDALPAALKDVLLKQWQADASDVVLLKLLTRLAYEPAVQRAISIAADANQPVELRRGMLSTIGDSRRVTAIPVLLPLVMNGSEPEPIQAAALDALRPFSDATVDAALLARAESAGVPPPIKAKIIGLLTGRATSATMLLNAVESGKLKTGDVSVDNLRQIALFQDKRLDERVRKNWGIIQGGTPEEKLAEVRAAHNDLRAGPGDTTSGKAIFTKTCAGCHTIFGQGGHVGPDLTTANRGDRDFLLVSIVDPNFVIRSEFLNHIVRTKDGQVLNGIVVEQSPAGVTLLGADGRRTTVARDRIDVLRESTTSIMPEG